MTHLGRKTCKAKRRHEAGSRRQRRMLRLFLEQLEPRLPLAGISLPGNDPNWFQIVSAPSHPGESWALDDTSEVQEWIVTLKPQVLGAGNDPAAAQSLLNPATVLQPGQPAGRVQVLRGLGLPGQLLVEVQPRVAMDVGQFLAANLFVEAATPNRVTAGQELAPPNDEEFGNQTHLAPASQFGIDAQAAWMKTTGTSDVVIAVVDSGIDLAHRDLYRNIWLNPGEIPPQLLPKLVDDDGDDRITLRDLNAQANAGNITNSNNNDYVDAEDVLNDPRWIDRSDGDNNGFVDDLFGWDFVDNDNYPLDDHGHGTHVAGILGAEGNNVKGVTGVTWQSSLLPVKFLDEGNLGDTANAIAATNYVTALRTRVAPGIDSLAGPVNVRVANNSWGFGAGSGDASLRNSIAAAGDAGILFVAGAGNGDILGRGIDLDITPFFPASFDLDNILSVAATASADALADFSNFGETSIDIAAPGEGILSTERGGDYGTRNGTSMAVPQVSGVAALVFALHPNASVAEVRNAILNEADLAPSLSRRVASGGRLNAARALNAQTFAPQAKLAVAPDITAKSTAPESLTIHFEDTNAIDASSFNSDDIFVTRMGFSSTILAATIVQPAVVANAKSYDVIYRVLPSDGEWDALDGGVYEVKLRTGQVRDVTGIASQGRTLGTFNVKIDSANVFIVNSAIDSVDAAPGDGQALDAPDAKGLRRTTLRAAIMEANALAGQQIIVVPEGVYLLGIEGANEQLGGTGDLDILGDVIILGTPPTDSNPPTTIIDARQLDRVFDIASGATVELKGLTIRGGLVESFGGSQGSGGGIRNRGALAVSAARITGNSASGAGGGIENRGTLSILGSWIDENFTTGTGDAGGGGLFNDGAAFIDSATFSGNRSAAGVIGNAGGGAIHNAGPGTIEILNSTISGNAATKGNGGGIFSAGLIRSANVTITQNAAPNGVGGGIFNEPGLQIPLAFDSQFGANGPAFDAFLNVEGTFVDAADNTYVSDTEHHRVQVFNAAGAFKFSIGGFGTAAGKFNTPSAIVVDSTGRIFVADTANARVQAFDPTGHFLFAVPAPGSFFGQTLALGPADSLYVYNGSQNRIIVYDRDGSSVRTIQLEFFSIQPLSCLVIDKQGNIIGVSPIGNSQIGYFLDSDGNLTGTFGGSGSGAGQFSFPTSAVLDSTGRIYVSDSNNSKVQVYSASGQFLYSFDVFRASGLAITPNNQLRVYDLARVGLYTLAGQFISSLGQPDSKLYPRALATSPAGLTIVADASNDRIQIYNADRTLQRQFGSRGSANGQFLSPTALAVDTAGRIVVADSANNRVQLFDSQGAFLGGIGSPGSGTGQFSGPQGVAVGASDRIYVADTVNHRIQVYGADRAFLFTIGSAGGGNGRFSAPKGLAIDGTGQLYVADSGNNRIQVFNKDGGFIRAFGALGSQSGQLNAPDNLAVNPVTGDIVVADRGNSRLSVFSSLGVAKFVLPFTPAATGQPKHALGIAADTLGKIYVAFEPTDSIQVFNPAPPAVRAVFLKNTIIAENSSMSDPDLRGAFQSQGHNLVGQVGFGTTGIVKSVNNDLVGSGTAPIAARLGPLEAMRGAVPAHAPLMNSPATDAGVTDPLIAVDQYGTLRPQNGDQTGSAAADIGAVERFDSRVRGLLFEDRNSNGVRDKDEAGLPGWTIFVDTNANGLIDPGETSTTSLFDDATTPLEVETGAFSFRLNSGTSRLVALPGPFYRPTVPQSVAANSPVTIRRVLLSGEPLPGLLGGKVTFIDSATMDEGRVAFVAFTLSSLPDAPNGGYAIFLAEHEGHVRPLVTVGSDGFSLETISSFDNGDVAFPSQGVGGQERLSGVYVVDVEGNISTIVDANSQIPGGNGSFNDIRFPRPTISDGLVLVTTFFNANQSHIPFFIGSSQTSLVRLTSLDPLNLIGVDELALDGTVLAFVARDMNFITSVYTATATSIATTIIGPSTLIPGTGSPFGFASTFSGLSLSGSRVALHGTGSNGEQGIYTWAEAGGLQRVVDKNTSIPGGAGKFTAFGRNTSQEGEILAFTGSGADGNSGIYVSIGGQLKTLVDTTMPFDGKTINKEDFVGPFQLSRDAVSGNEIAFLCRFTDGTSAIYVATIQPISAQLVSVAVGQEVDGITFGMRPLDGSLGGVVFEDANRDGIRSANENGLESWTVYIDVNSNGKRDLDEPRELTLADGSYRFAERGGNQSYRVRVEIQPGFEATSPAATPGFRDVLVGPGQEVISASFGIRRSPNSTGVGASGILRGQVFSDQDGDGKKNMNEPGLAGWQVFIDADRDGVFEVGERGTTTVADDPATVGTNEAGNYEFKNLARSTGLVVRVIAQTGSQQTSPRDNVFRSTDKLLEGISPQEVVVADFNADGAPDLAFANDANNDVRVLLNIKTTDSPQGTGRFTPLAPVTRLNEPTDLATGDFNGDNLADLVVGNANRDKLNILFQEGGTLTGFRPLPTPIVVGEFQKDVLVTRLDKSDLHDDIVVVLERRTSTDDQGQVVIFKGKGSGQFENPIRIDVGDLPQSVTAGDFDGDGDQDLVVALAARKRLQVLPNDNGDFTKPLPPFIQMLEEPFFVLAVGVAGDAKTDITGDGKPDLVTANLADGTLSLFRNTSSPSKIEFMPAQNPGVLQGPKTIAAFDLDQDQDVDLVVGDGSGNNATVLRNRGLGIFGAPESAGIVVLDDGIGHSVLTADLDGDRLAEIVVARGDNTFAASGGFAGNVSLFKNELAPGANRAAIPNGNDLVTSLDFAFFVPSTSFPWFNEAKPEDVNGDLKITVFDALAVINYLNSALPGNINRVPANAVVGKPFGFIDVAKDNIISVLDAVKVINRLNSPNLPDGEGESGDAMEQFATTGPLSATAARRRKTASLAVEIAANDRLEPRAVDAVLEGWHIGPGF